MEHLNEVMTLKKAYFKRDKYKRPMFFTLDSRVKELYEYAKENDINCSILHLNDGGQFDGYYLIVVSNYDEEDFETVNFKLYKDSIRAYVPRKIVLQ